MSRVSPQVPSDGLMSEAAADMRAFDASLDLLDEAAARALGISRSDLRAMELVSRQGQATAGQLAEQLGLTTGAVTGLIDRMEEARYFRRNGDPTDRRKVVIQLTPKGRERERRIYGPLGQAWAGELSAYSPEELAVIRRFLRKGRAVIDGVVARMSAGHARKTRD